MLEFALGFMVATVLALLGCVGVGFWRFKKVFESYKKSLEDVYAAVLNEVKNREQLAANIKTEMGLRKAITLDDETVARAEARLQARAAGWNFTEDVPLVG